MITAEVSLLLAVLLAVLGSYGLALGIFFHLSSRIDVLFGLLNHVINNDIRHLNVAVDILLAARLRDVASGDLPALTRDEQDSSKRPSAKS